MCVCVCLSIKSHLISGASVHCKNAAKYSAGKEGQKVCDVFSETLPLQRLSTPSNDIWSGFPVDDRELLEQMVD